MTQVAARLHRALIAAAIPIVGVSIGRETVRASWEIQYDPTATAAQRLQGDALLATFDPNDANAVNAELDAYAQYDIDQNKALQAIVMITYKYLNPAAKPATLALFAKEIRDKYKTL